MENGHSALLHDANNGKGDEKPISPYENKYTALLKRCESIQQNSERLVYRLNYVKRLTRRLRHERRFLKRRLEKYNDEYQDIPFIFPMHEDSDLVAGELPGPGYHANPQMPDTGASASGTSMQCPSPNQLPTPLIVVKTEPTSSPTTKRKKSRASDKEKHNQTVTKSTNPFFLYTQDQPSNSTIESLLQFHLGGSK